MTCEKYGPSRDSEGAGRVQNKRALIGSTFCSRIRKNAEKRRRFGMLARILANAATAESRMVL